MTCGTPTPATTRVVQIAPGPMPTFTASAPASISASAASPVAMLPATTSNSPESAAIRATISITPREWPCAVSTTRTSAPAAIERLRALDRVRPDADRGADAQPAVRVLRRVREVDALLDVLDGDQAR